MHRGVVELHALADADRAGAQYDDLLLVRQDAVVFVAVAGVEVGDVLTRVQGVHHPEDRRNPVFLPQGVDLRFLPVPQDPDLLVPEAHHLGFLQQADVARRRLQADLHLRDLLQGLEEQLRDHGLLMDGSDVLAPAQQFRHRVERVRPEVFNVFPQFFCRHRVELRQLQVAHAGLKAPHTLEHALLQRAADAHDLAGRLHLGAQLVAGRGELVEGEAREFRDDVVQGRLHGRVAAGYRDLLQRHAQGDLCRHAGNGIAAGLAGQGRGAADPGIDFDQVVFTAVRIQGKLHIAAAGDLQLPDDLDRAVVEHLQVCVAQAQDRGHDDAVSGVHAHGIHVLHAADRDRLVVAVPHDLELDLLVSADALFDQHLVHRAQAEGVRADLNQFFLVVREAAAGAAQRERRPQYHRIADLQGGLFACSRS